MSPPNLVNRIVVPAGPPAAVLTWRHERLVDLRLCLRRVAYGLLGVGQIVPLMAT